MVHLHVRSVLRAQLAALACFALPAAAQEEPAAQDPLVAQLGIAPEVAALFARVVPEMLRYQKLAYYGNTFASTQPAAELVDAEVELYRARRAAGGAPDRSDALLCFNLLVHRPEVGQEYLAAIVAGTTPGADGFVDAAVTYGTMASGSWGERFALTGLEGKSQDWRRFWIRFLARDASEPATGARLRELVGEEADVEVRAWMYYALGLLLERDAVAAIRAGIADEPAAEVRVAMVFAVAEILGRDALPWLESLADGHEDVRAQIKDSTEYLRTGTSDDNKHGYEVANDAEFVDRFADLDTPAIAWLARAGRLEGAAVEAAKPLSAKEKAELFDALEASLGFGLEAVKGALFQSLEPGDLPRLRRLRQLSAWCPNALSEGRRRTLMIMIRSLRA